MDKLTVSRYLSWEHTSRTDRWIKQLLNPHIHAIDREAITWDYITHNIHIFAYRKQLKSGGVEGLRTRLGLCLCLVQTVLKRLSLCWRYMNSIMSSKPKYHHRECTPIIYHSSLAKASFPGAHALVTTGSKTYTPSNLRNAIETFQTDQSSHENFTRKLKTLNDTTCLCQQDYSKSNSPACDITDTSSP